MSLGVALAAANWAQEPRLPELEGALRLKIQRVEPGLQNDNQPVRAAMVRRADAEDGAQRTGAKIFRPVALKPPAPGHLSRQVAVQAAPGPQEEEICSRAAP
mmetsp:Transcript_96596/g.174423  ORF Transcript_96596/g.174423 Transcript_96596/m.174423 type:complete len:102 (+) Transcript_96596:299-604(+)